MTPWMTAPEIARLLRIPTAEVYRGAREKQWLKTKDGKRPTLYSTEDSLA